MKLRRIVALCSSLDLAGPYACTPSWWQLLKALAETGVEVIATPYHSAATDTLWWRAEPNPCRWESDLFSRFRSLWPRQTGQRGEPLGERLQHFLVAELIRPRWQRHLAAILDRHRPVDALVVLTVPMNHLTGVPTALRRHLAGPIVFYDGDAPASLPAFGGFSTGFRSYRRADLAEYDAVLSNSLGAAVELRRMGARRVEVLHYAADPDVFRPVGTEQDVDVLFYGTGHQFRREWIEQMLIGPSQEMDGRFAIRGGGFDDLPLGRVERLPQTSFGELPRLVARARINLLITRGAHASVYGSSTARPFELAALGCAIVSNPTAGIEEWFEPDRDLIVVHNQAEAVAAYRTLLADPAARAALGRQARARLLQEHTYRHRAEQLIKILEAI
ncbi:MAG: glycosyltransferase [Chloroflexi bacterium]|nr:glycosyltransferase [Chloroflexota bacterium]